MIFTLWSRPRTFFSQSSFQFFTSAALILGSNFLFSCLHVFLLKDVRLWLGWQAHPFHPMTTPKPRALLFSGQGAQKVGMGADLFENSISTHALYELADSRLGWPLSDYSFNGPETILTETRVC